MSPPGVCTSMYVFPRCVCSSVCMTLHVHFPSVNVPPVCMSHYFNAPSVRISPPCVIIYLVVALCVCHLHVHVPPCVRPSVYMLLPHVSPFMCPLYDCCWKSYSSNNRLMRQVRGLHRFTSVPTSVGRWDAFSGVHRPLCPSWLGHWGAISGVHRLTSWVRSLGYVCSFDSYAHVLLSLRIRLLCYRQLRVRLFFSCLSIDARRDATQNLT